MGSEKEERKRINNSTYLGVHQHGLPAGLALAAHTGARGRGGVGGALGLKGVGV